MVRSSLLACLPRLALIACLPPGAGCDGPEVQSFAVRCEGQVRVDAPQPPALPIDVLFVVDDAPAMAALAPALPGRLATLLQRFEALAAQGVYVDLHLGVVSGDYGAGHGAPGCDPVGGGDGARLLPLGHAAPAGCRAPIGAPYVRYAWDARGGHGNLPDGQDLEGTLVCMASMGSGGCAFPHLLEAARAALHGDVAENAGFLRPGARLAVVLASNADDLSAPPDSALFDTGVDVYGQPRTFRAVRSALVCGDPARMLAAAPTGEAYRGCGPAPNLGGQGPGGLYDLRRYIGFFTRPAIEGGVKEDPSLVSLHAAVAPGGPVEVILAAQAPPGAGPHVRCAGADADAVPPCLPVLDYTCASEGAPRYYGSPATRIPAVVAAAARSGATSVCATRWLDAFTVEAPPALPATAGCLPAPLAHPDRPECTVEDLVTGDDGVERALPVPRCADGGGTFPCWRFDVGPRCRGLSSDPHGVVIERDGAPAPSAHARITCGVRCD